MEVAGRCHPTGEGQNAGSRTVAKILSSVAQFVNMLRDTNLNTSGGADLVRYVKVIRKGS